MSVATLTDNASSNRFEGREPVAATNRGRQCVACFLKEGAGERDVALVGRNVPAPARSEVLSDAGWKLGVA